MENEIRKICSVSYQRIAAAPASVRWDDYRPAHSPYGTIAFAEPRARAGAGPGARYARLTDLSVVGSDGRHPASYWQVVS